MTSGDSKMIPLLSHISYTSYQILRIHGQTLSTLTLSNRHTAVGQKLKCIGCSYLKKWM